MLRFMGPPSFLVLAAVAAAALVYVAAVVPETKGRTLQEVQGLLAVPEPDGGSDRPRPPCWMGVGPWRTMGGRDAAALGGASRDTPAPSAAEAAAQVELR